MCVRPPFIIVRPLHLCGSGLILDPTPRLLELVAGLQGGFAEFAEHLVGGQRIPRITTEALCPDNMRGEAVLPDSRPNKGSPAERNRPRCAAHHSADPHQTCRYAGRLLPA